MPLQLMPEGLYLDMPRCFYSLSGGVQHGATVDGLHG